MTPREIELVKTSWIMVRPIAANAAHIFYERLFETDPRLRSLFKGDMDAQGRKLMAALNTVVNSLDRLETMIPMIEGLGQRHAGYGVTARDYQAVGAALLWTLQQGLGESFTEEVETAWRKAYTTLADIMRSAAAQAA